MRRQAQYPCFKVSGFSHWEGAGFFASKSNRTRRTAQRKGTSHPRLPRVKKWRIFYAGSNEKIFYPRADPDYRPVPPPAGRNSLQPFAVLLPGTGPWTQAGTCPRLAQGFASAAGNLFPVAFGRLHGDHTDHDIQRRRTSWIGCSQPIKPPAFNGSKLIGVFWVWEVRRRKAGNGQIMPMGEVRPFLKKKGCTYVKSLP